LVVTAMGVVRCRLLGAVVVAGPMVVIVIVTVA